MAQGKKPDYKVLFDLQAYDDGPQSQPTRRQELPTKPILGQYSDTTQEIIPSLPSFKSSKSQPLSASTVHSTAWTHVQHDNTLRRPVQSKRFIAGIQPATASLKKSPNSSDEEMNGHLVERVDRASVKHLRPGNFARDHAQQIHKFRNNDVEDYLRQIQDGYKTGTWLDCPEVPTSKELLDENEPWTKTKLTEDGETVVLDGNKLMGPWPDVDTYLSAHFGMLREEAVHNLRNAIGIIKENPDAPEGMMPDNAIGIYSQVRLTAITFSRRGLGIRVVFSLSMVGKKIRWEQSKRLPTGTLVVLTPSKPSKDMFKDKCIVAVVAARPLELLDQDPPQLDLFISREYDIDLDPTIEYTMVEHRTSFFEATRHVGSALKKMATEQFPLAEHIIGVNQDVPPPQYIQKSPIFDLSTIFESDNLDRYKGINVLKEWPFNAQTTLDDSQQKAIQHIFNRRVAIVQGPPGTGKSHVSVQALRVLLSNMGPDDPPIVISCQTNHALDQLLRHIAPFEENFIRLGGRSKDQDVVKERTLYNVRQKIRFNVQGSMTISARGDLDALEEEMKSLLAPLIYGKDVPDPGFLDIDLYRKEKVLTEKQCKRLEEGDTEWASSVGNDKPALEQWLGRSLLHHRRQYQPDNLGLDFEEADLEFEQLKELEAENVCQDDLEHDIESLRGNKVDLFLTIGGKKGDLSKDRIEKLLRNDNLWKISPRERGPVFNFLVRKVISRMNERFHILAAKYDRCVTKYRYGNFESNAILLRQQRVIGVTTTGLSKYRALIAAARPRVLVIEEAAETMECHIAAGCLPSLEHLILVGDHKQLRPQCGVKMLEHDPFHLNVSLFERLVDNRLPFEMLKKQRRMIPEVRRLLAPIYGDDIEDHASVLGPKMRPSVPGMGKNSFFYSHAWPDSIDEQMSSTNTQEADMVVCLYDYLISNGLADNEMTILTFYNGQRKLILRKLRNHPRLSRMEGSDKNRIFKVLTVDSYQGEENEVVLLSLVKSNEQGKIGFTGVENRVCVALSRAKRGFYIFGNAELLAGESKLWAKVINIMLNDTSTNHMDRKSIGSPLGRVVFRIPLLCSNHSIRTYIEKMEDWDNIAGGCEKPCSESLPCGHPCRLTCHPFDHDKITCPEKCDKILSCGHKCSRDCCARCMCFICGRDKTFSSMISTVNENEPPARALIGDFDLQPSDVQAWQAFADEGRHDHDAERREMQREFYLQHQARKLNAKANNLPVASAQVALIDVTKPEQIETAEELLIDFS